MTSIIDRIGEATGVHPRVVWVLAAVLAALLIGTALRVWRPLLLRGRDEKSRQRLASLATWWGLFLLLTAVVLAGRYAVVALFGVASLAGLGEYRRLVAGRVGGGLWWWAILAVPIHYLFVAAGALGPFWTFIPVWVLVILLVRLVIGQQTQTFLETAGTVFLGLMVLVYLLSHAALLTTLPLVSDRQETGGMGLFVFLVLLTESNDIAQALWGRRWGRHKITPRVSPHKTWEGFLLGMATTVVLAIVLSGVLTPLADGTLRFGEFAVHVPYLPAVIAGVLIAVGGFFGDVTISSIKREVGVKDSGSLLPGQGGLLDRIDSLTFAGPLFFYFIYIFCD